MGTIPSLNTLFHHLKIEFPIRLRHVIAFFTDAKVSVAKKIPVAGKKES